MSDSGQGEKQLRAFELPLSPPSMPNFLSLSRFSKATDTSPGRQRTQSDAQASAPKLFVTSDSSDGETMPASTSTPSRRSSQSGGQPTSSKKPMDRHALSNYYQRRSLTEDDGSLADDMPTPTIGSHLRATSFQDMQATRPGQAEEQPKTVISSAERIKQEYTDDVRRRTASTPALPAASASSVADEQGRLPDAWKAAAPEAKREKGRSPWRRGSRGPDPANGIAGALAASGMAIAHPASNSNLTPPVPPLPTRMRRSPSQVSVQSTSSVDEGANKSDAGQRGRHAIAQAHVPRTSEGEVSGSETEDSESRFILDEDAMPVTGFAVASSKRNADFHDLFPQITADDYLIEGAPSVLGWNRQLTTQQTTDARCSARSSYRGVSTSRRTTCAFTPTSLAGSPTCALVFLERQKKLTQPRRKLFPSLKLRRSRRK